MLSLSLSLALSLFHTHAHTHTRARAHTHTLTPSLTFLLSSSLSLPLLGGDTSLSCATKTLNIIPLADDLGLEPPGIGNFTIGCFFIKEGCPPAGGHFASELGADLPVPSKQIFSDTYPSEEHWIQYVAGTQVTLV